MTISLPVSARRRVLVVDDDAVSMEVLALLLDHDGHEVLRAAGGEAALHLLSEGDRAASLDVLLVDMRMPGVSGDEVARHVRAMAGRRPLLLAMSATGIGEEHLQAFDGFLLKPLSIEDLRRGLNLKQRGRGSAAADDRPVRPSVRAPNRASFSADTIDRAVLGKLESAMSRRALEELYTACVADTRARTAALKKQVLAGDLTGVPRQGHQIKGAAAMVGAARMARLASSLELGSCKEEDTLRLLDDLLACCDELERILLAGKLQKTQ